jgi:hypothetical protein
VQSVTTTTRTRVSRAKSARKPALAVGEISVRIDRATDAKVEKRGVNGPTADTGATTVEITIKHPSWAMGKLRVHEVAEGNHMDPHADNYYGNDLLRFSFTTPDRGAAIMRQFAAALVDAANKIQEAVDPPAPPTVENVADWQAQNGTWLN